MRQEQADRGEPGDDMATHTGIHKDELTVKELLDLLDAAFEALSKAGIRVAGGSRFWAIRRELSRAVKAERNLIPYEELDEKLLAEGCGDAWDLVKIVSCNRLVAEASDDIRKVLEGTLLQEEEQLRSNPDLQFQLFMEATFNELGLPTEHLEPDFLF
ncbi:MAG: hypothetical protein ACYC53_08765 [Bacillota bacterium]